MRVVVTGAGNPYGKAIVQQLLANGHQVRLFAGNAQDAEGLEGARWHPGSLEAMGSIEPVLSEREVLIHAACLDVPGKDKDAFARRIYQGTMSCRYGAERELMDQFIHVTPDSPPRGLNKAFDAAAEAVQGSRKVHTVVIHAKGDPASTAHEIVATMESGPNPGRYPGRETDAVAP